jgi:hypothetical protein
MVRRRPDSGFGSPDGQSIMAYVNAYDGPARLLWRANRAVAMACDVGVLVAELGAGWAGRRGSTRRAAHPHRHESLGYVEIRDVTAAPLRAFVRFDT